MFHVIITNDGLLYLFTIQKDSQFRNPYPHLTSQIIPTECGTFIELDIEPVICAIVDPHSQVLSVVNRRTRTVTLYPSDRVPENFRKPVEIPEIRDVTQVFHTFTNLLILDIQGDVYSYMMDPSLYVKDDDDFTTVCRVEQNNLDKLQPKKIVRFDLPPVKCFVRGAPHLFMLTMDNKILYAEWSPLDDVYCYVNEERISTHGLPVKVENINASSTGSLTISDGQNLYLAKGREKHSEGGLEFDLCPFDAVGSSCSFYNGVETLIYLNGNQELCFSFGDEDWESMIELGVVFEEDQIPYELYVIKDMKFDFLYEPPDTADYLLVRGNELYSFFSSYENSIKCKPRLIYTFPGAERLNFNQLNIPNQPIKSARNKHM